MYVNGTSLAYHDIGVFVESFEQFKKYGCYVTEDPCLSTIIRSGGPIGPMP